MSREPTAILADIFRLAGIQPNKDAGDPSILRIVNLSIDAIELLNREVALLHERVDRLEKANRQP